MAPSKLLEVLRWYSLLGRSWFQSSTGSNLRSKRRSAGSLAGNVDSLLAMAPYMKVAESSDLKGSSPWRDSQMRRLFYILGAIHQSGPTNTRSKSIELKTRPTLSDSFLGRIGARWIWTLPI